MKAYFIGYQEDGEGNYFPLFNIDAPKAPKHGSTVSIGTLRELGIRIPTYPLYEEWKRLLKGDKYDKSL